jgi:hypothetical protein
MIIVPGLDEYDQYNLNQLLEQLERKARRNALRNQYYEAKYSLRDLNIAIPPKFRNFDAVLGWPAKAVDVLSKRCNIDGFVVPGIQDAAENLGINDVWQDNRLTMESTMAHSSAMIHSCSFLCTVLGDTTIGEPPVLMLVKSALDATGIWDERLRALRSALSVIDRDMDGHPTSVVMYYPDRAVMMQRDWANSTNWQINEIQHDLGRVPVEPLIFNPTPMRPFGSSRISRAVMSLTDSALRTVVRAEISAEFYTAPQRWALNLPTEAFADGGWSAILGRILAIEPPGLDDDADPSFQPQLGQFPQMSMQPHTEQLRMWATMFSGETAIPVGSLGIVQDNPSSAEAIYAAKEELVIEAESANRVFSLGWVRSMQNALMLRDGLTELPAEWRNMKAVWRDPSTPSKASAADAMAKTVAVLPWVAESEVVLEKMGWDRTDIERAKADRRRSTVGQAVTALRAARVAGVQSPGV